MKRRQYLDGTVTSKLTRLHIVELVLSPFGQTLTFGRHVCRHVDRSFIRRLNELECIGSNMDIGGG